MSTDPPVTLASELFWEATRERELRFQWCDACERWVSYPRPRCPRCTGDRLSWRAPEGVPTLYSWALHPGRGGAASRMVVLVDVAEGLRIVSSLLEPHAGIEAGHPLELDWQPLEDGRALPVFRLTSRSAPGASA